MPTNNIFLVLQDLGFKMVSFFNWFFDYLNQPISLLGNLSILELSFSTAITAFLISAVVTAFFGD